MAKVLASNHFLTGLPVNYAAAALDDAFQADAMTAAMVVTRGGKMIAGSQSSTAPPQRIWRQTILKHLGLDQGSQPRIRSPSGTLFDYPANLF